MHGGKRAAVGLVVVRTLVTKSVDSGLSGSMTQGIPWNTAIMRSENPMRWKNGVVERIKSSGVNRSGTPATRPGGIGTWAPWSNAPKYPNVSWIGLGKPRVIYGIRARMSNGGHFKMRTCRARTVGYKCHFILDILDCAREWVWSGFLCYHVGK